MWVITPVGKGSQASRFPARRALASRGVRCSRDATRSEAPSSIPTMRKVERDTKVREPSRRWSVKEVPLGCRRDQICVFSTCTFEMKEGAPVEVALNEGDEGCPFLRGEAQVVSVADGGHPVPFHNRNR